MRAYKLAAGLPLEQPKIGKLKYLVMIFKRGEKTEFVEGFEYHSFLGFLNYKCQHIGIFFTGNKALPPFGRIVQLPYLFNTKKQCKETITQARKHDKAFRKKNLYEIVPIDINAPMEEVVKQI